MTAVDGKWSEHWENAIVEGAFERVLRLIVQIGNPQQPYAFAFERRKQIVVEHAHLLRQGTAQALRDGRQVLAGRAAVLRAAHDLRLDLLLDRGYSDHKELVEVRTVNRDEL